MFTRPIPVLADFNLFAYMTWTSRQVVSARSGIPSLFSSGPVTTTTTPSAADILDGVLPDTTTTVAMTIVQREPFATKFTQDYTDATLVDGLSSMGGLWTTLDALFTLFFGASVLYFAFGKRPLSPLGMVHIFHRRTLTRNWHEDFPTVRTEGGEPGAENAGVVAFLRDRWLDVVEEEEEGPDSLPRHQKDGEPEQPAPWV
ncbi:hypothetical protein C8R46DRAFT_1272884 [Mycena filopes]|nr:hypothetical protein C8R46DRAFT_1272884 [Mycena filopes]